MGICWWEPAHERVFRPEELSLGARLLFKVFYTIDKVMLVRQMLCLLWVAKLLLLLAFLLWKAMFLQLVFLASGSLPFCLTAAGLPKMPIIVSPAELSLIFSPYAVLPADCVFPRLAGASCWPCCIAQVRQQVSSRTCSSGPGAPRSGVPSSVHPAPVPQLVLGRWAAQPPPAQAPCGC